MWPKSPDVEYSKGENTPPCTLPITHIQHRHPLHTTYTHIHTTHRPTHHTHRPNTQVIMHTTHYIQHYTYNMHTHYIHTTLHVHHTKHFIPHIYTQRDKTHMHTHRTHMYTTSKTCIPCTKYYMPYHMYHMHIHLAYHTTDTYNAHGQMHASSQIEVSLQSPPPQTHVERWLNKNTYFNIWQQIKDINTRQQWPWDKICHLL